MSKPCTPVVHIKIAGKWMSIPLKMVSIGIDPYPYPKSGIHDIPVGSLQIRPFSHHLQGLEVAELFRAELVELLFGAEAQGFWEVIPMGPPRPKA